MSDLIDREDVIRIAQDRLNSPYMQNKWQQGACLSILRAIEELPSADVVSLEEFEQMRFLADKSMEMVGEERPKKEWMPIGAVCEVICRHCIKANGCCQHHWKCPLLTEIAELIEPKDEPQTCSFGLHMDCSLCWKESHCRAIKEAERKEREGE